MIRWEGIELTRPLITLPIARKLEDIYIPANLSPPLYVWRVSYWHCRYLWSQAPVVFLGSGSWQFLHSNTSNTSLLAGAHHCGQVHSTYRLGKWCKSPLSKDKEQSLGKLNLLSTCKRTKVMVWDPNPTTAFTATLKVRVPRWEDPGRYNVPPLDQPFLVDLLFYGKSFYIYLKFLLP